MPIEAKVIADSINENGNRLTTMQLVYPRFIHSEYMTHRKFSRNASSSRAIPIAKMIEQVVNNPAMPIHWGKNQPGMQAHEELNDSAQRLAKDCWIGAAYKTACIAKEMHELGLHKQVVNRILEPFQYIHVVVSSTEWDNFFGLRDHPDAQPEIQELAKVKRIALNESIPVLRKEGEWHLPYITEEERSMYPIQYLRDMSSARCCRVSYLKHDNTAPNIQDDLLLCEKLKKSNPIHASPFEHVASPAPRFKDLWGNFDGWGQYRKMIERGF